MRNIDTLLFFLVYRPIMQSCVISLISFLVVEENNLGHPDNQTDLDAKKNTSLVHANNTGANQSVHTNKLDIAVGIWWYIKLFSQNKKKQHYT